MKSNWCSLHNNLKIPLFKASVAIICFTVFPFTYPLGPGWFLDKVVISEEFGGTSKTFACGRWVVLIDISSTVSKGVM